MAVCVALCRPAVAGPQPGQDLFLGNGTPGPFALSWQKIEAATERVQVNSLPQMRGLDYALDADAGILTFTRPLPRHSAIRIDYAYDPAHAARAVGGMSLPLSLELFQTERGSVSLSALYQKPDASSTEAANGSLTVGMGMAWQGANNSQVSTHLLYAPALAAQVGVADSASRTGLAVSGATDVGQQAQVSFGFSRAGTGLGNGGASDIPAGLQTLTLGSRITPSRQVQAELGFAQSHSLMEIGGDTSKTSLTLAVSPDNRVHLDTHLSQTSTEGRSGENADVSLSVKPNDRLSMQTNLAQAANDAGLATQTWTVSADAKPSATAQVNASYSSKNAPGAANDAQAVALNATVTPSAVLSLNAELQHSRQGESTSNQQALQMALSPSPKISLQTSLALHQEGDNATVVAGIDGKIRPLPFLEVAGGYHDRNAPAADPNALDNLDTSRAQIALSPLKTVRLTGTYVQNPDADGSPERLAQRGVGVETTLGALSVSGGYDWLRHYDTSDVGATTHIDVGLRFSSAAQFQVGYQQSLTGLNAHPGGTTLLSIGFTKQLGERLNLSLRGKRRQAVGAASPTSPDYDASANLGMKF